MAEKDAIHIASLDIRNVHKISVAKVDFVPGKGLVKVTGLNASGKTSLMRAIRAALGGGKEIRPNALKEGEEAGYSTVGLSNGFIVTRNITMKNPKGSLVIRDPEGGTKDGKGKYNQGTVNEWIGDGSFDPLSFMDLKPADMRDALLSIATDPELPTKLDALKTAHASIYEKRTPLISRKQVADRMECPSGERPEPVDVSAEMETLSAAQAAQQQRALLLDTISANEQLIQDLRERIQAADGALEEQRTELESVPDVSEHIEAGKARIAEANAVNEQLEPWRAWDGAMLDKKAASEAIEELTAKLKTLESEERKLLADSGIPIDGLSFSEEGEPLLNDRPLSVASGQERVKFFVSVAFAMDPDLRACLLDEEGNSLDLEALEELDALAKSKNFQVFICRIGLEGGGEIVVEDGVAKGSEG